MLDLVCDSCGNILILDHIKTVKDYSDNINYIISDSNKLEVKDIPIYTYYRCIKCSTSYKFDVKEYDIRLRSVLSQRALDLKKHEIAKNIDPYQVDPDNGLEYCGKCSGYDDEGNCLVDIIKQCKIRKLV